MMELGYHEWLLKNPRPPWVKAKTRTGNLNNVKFSSMIGYFDKKQAYLDVESPVNVMSRVHYKWIMSIRLEPRRKPSNPKKIFNFVGRVRGLKVFIGNFTYKCDFMVLEDTTSVIDHDLGEPSKSNEEEPPKEVDMKNEVERKVDDELAKSAKENVTKNKEDELAGTSSSQAVGKKDIGGNFEISCNVGKFKNINALVDQGSNVNVMPFSIYNKLTDKRPIETDNRLSLASHLYIYPLGIAEDVLVDVDGYVYLVDFMILDIRDDQKRPFILWTPFLTTTKAIIKFDKGTITLRSEKSKISFHRILEPHCRIEKGIKNDIEPIAPTMTVNRLVLE
nr:protein kinase-like domain, concanavalin A-like lectin/glucanase domain protein [Tanacetum cinerariifolium]